MSKRIGDLTIKGSKLAVTDEVEISLFGSAGSRKITGKNIADFITDWIKDRDVVFNVRDPQFAGGAKGDGTTDDILAFEACRDAAFTAGGIIYVPPVSAGLFYKLSRAWVFTNHQNVKIFGRGEASVIVIANSGGDNAITLSGCKHARISDIGLAGYAASGHAIEIANDSHWPLISHVTVSGAGANAFHVSGGIDARFDHCEAQQDEGYDLTYGSLGGSLGHTQIGYCVTSNPNGHNNNPQFVNCISEANAVYALKIGDSTDVVDSMLWSGGLLEGTASHQEVYLRGHDHMILNTHIEHSVITDTYAVTLDRCTNCHIIGGVLDGAIQFLGCASSGVEQKRGTNFYIDENCVDCYVRDCTSGSESSGGVTDLGLNSDIRQVRASNLVNGGYGYWPRSRMVSSTSGRSFSSGAVEGWTVVGSPTVSQSVDGSGNATGRLQITATGLTQSLRKNLGPIEFLRGKWITVDVTVTNADATKPLLITAFVDGSSTFTNPSTATTTRQRAQAAFFVPTATASIAVDLQGLNGADLTIKSILVSVSDFIPATTSALGSAAGIPDLGDNGYMVPTYTTVGSGTAITSFASSETGKVFVVLFSGGRTITHSSNMLLDGAVDFVGADGDSITLVRRSDGKFQEISRTVIA